MPNARYLGRWVDGSPADRNRRNRLVRREGLPETGQPRPIRSPATDPLAHRQFAARGARAESWVEFVGGDTIPGRVVRFRDGTESAKERLAPHLALVPYGSLDPPDSSGGASCE